MGGGCLSNNMVLIICPPPLDWNRINVISAKNPRGAVFDGPELAVHIVFNLTENIVTLLCYRLFLIRSIHYFLN